MCRQVAVCDWVVEQSGTIRYADTEMRITMTKVNQFDVQWKGNMFASGATLQFAKSRAVAKIRELEQMGVTL
jgi:hypothetical protein